MFWMKRLLPGLLSTSGTMQNRQTTRPALIGTGEPVSLVGQLLGDLPADVAYL